MPEILCPKCKAPVAVDADGSMTCEHCLISWPNVDELEKTRRYLEAVAGAPKPSDEAKRMLAREERTDANWRIREIMGALDPLSAQQFAVMRAELCQRYGVTTREMNAFYARAHQDRKQAREAPHEPPRREEPSELPFRILGTANDGLTYFIDRSERVQTLRLGSLTKTQLQLLAPITWWVATFPGARGRLEVDMAIDFLIEHSNGKSFDLATLRGRGCWREE